MGNHPRSLRYRPIQSDISRLKFNKTTTTYKFDKGNQTICLRIRERVVRTGVVERTRTTTRSVNSPSRKKVKNTPKSSRCLVMVASKPSASTAPNVSHTSEASSARRLDQPRRHHLAFAPRLPRREGRRDPQVQRGRSSLPESVRRAARERKDQRDGYIWPRRRRRLQLRVR